MVLMKRMENNLNGEMMKKNSWLGLRKLFPSAFPPPVAHCIGHKQDRVLAKLSEFLLRYIEWNSGQLYAIQTPSFGGGRRSCWSYWSTSGNRSKHGGSGEIEIEVHLKLLSIRFDCWSVADHRDSRYVIVGR